MPNFVEVPAGDYETRPSEQCMERYRKVPEYDHFAEAAGPAITTLEEPLYVARFPVTNVEFEAVIPDHQRSLYGPDDCHPVTAVTYYEAVRFCQEHGYRLLTRREWLVAALGAKGSLGWTLSNSPDMDITKINYFNPALREPGPNLEANYPPNPFGIYDMNGNVGEFNNPIMEIELEGVKYKLVTISTGSWGSCKDAAMPYTFFNSDPFLRNDRVGFRVAKDAA